MKKISVYYTVINEERFTPTLSEEEARKVIRADAKELQTKAAEWTVEEVIEEVAEVSGSLVEGDNGRIVHWTCPYTGEKIASEIFSDEESPALMFTSGEDKLALVSW